ncbi:hypothetical protein PSTT_07353 [Puccinia striiformis]|uniref:U1 small nuclear ribonucleoprotein C n=4 Tax=Puccinia striiformis TaxID=27350 RepID=A0A2S4VGN1_9BASI|nr:hypothetical protein PSTT_07353 [Puccinia striiformis]
MRYCGSGLGENGVLGRLAFGRVCPLTNGQQHESKLIDGHLLFGYRRERKRIDGRQLGVSSTTDSPVRSPLPFAGSRAPAFVPARGIPPDILTRPTTDSSWPPTRNHQTDTLLNYPADSYPIRKCLIGSFFAMGKYYCDYCDVFLVSESPSVRKAHNSGRNHLTNVRDYYSSLGHDKAQSYIDEITRMFETGGGNSTSNRGPGGPPPGSQPGPPNHGMGGPMRPPFSNSTAMPNMPPLPPAMMALMNGQNGMSSPGSGPPPMRFAGPPITNGMPPGMPPPPHMNGYSSGPMPPHPPPASGGQGGPPSAAVRMNPDRARQLGLH